MKKVIIAFAAAVGITVGFYSTSVTADDGSWKTYGPWYLVGERPYNHLLKTCSYRRDTVWYSPGLGINYGWDSVPAHIPIGEACPPTINL